MKQAAFFVTVVLRPLNRTSCRYCLRKEHLSTFLLFTYFQFFVNVSSQVIAEEFILNFILKYRNYEKKSEISFLAWKVRSSLFETFF